MDTSGYESLSFNNTRAINVAGSVEERAFPSHRHAYGEIIVVGSGDKNIFRVDDKLYSLTPGDIILVWPMETHEIVDANREDCIIVQYSNTLADSLFDFKRIINRYHNLHILCIKSHPELVNKLKSIIEKLKVEWLLDNPNREMRCSIHLLEFMSILDEHHEELEADISNDGGKTISDTTLNNIITVMDYIKNNLTADDLSSTAMADRIGLNKDYFSRAFKDVTGINYVKWLNATRVEKAISLLSDDSLSLTEIAMLSGFKSIPTFNRVFIQYKGMPPSKYLKNLKDIEL
ncbi:MAG: helix-turn-helix domain-containing protein [Clostridiales bacterium]|nr:helix-turn-helix domain-containing protein [Clostridiales bacterium]